MRKIYLFIAMIGETQTQTEVLMINSSSLEEALQEVNRKYNDKKFIANFVNSVEIDQLIKDLEIPTMRIVATEEPAKPTLDNLAQLLLANGYNVSKKV